MIKKIIVLSTVLLFVFLSGCQATPEQAVVVQKDTEEMLEMARAEQDEEDQSDVQMLRDKLSAPESVQDTINVEDGKLVVNIDTEVLVPEKSNIQIISARPMDFPQAFVNQMIDVLFGDTLLHEANYTMTKAEIEYSMLQLERLKSEYEDEPDEIAYIAEKIKALNEEYNDAPEAVEKIAADGRLKLREHFKSGVGMVQRYEINLETEGDHSIQQFFQVSNQTFPEGRSERPVSLEASMSYSDHSVFMETDNGKKPTQAYDGMEIDDEVKERLGILPSEAVDMVLDIFECAGIDDVALSRMYMIDNEMVGNADDIVSPATAYAYEVFFTREVDRIPCTLANYRLMPEANNSASPSWGYESIRAIVNGDGVAYISWTAPLEIMDTKVEDTALLGFDEIYDRFEAQVKIENIYLGESLKSVVIDVDRIALEYQRMRIKDEDISHALLVPVWSFYGVVTRDCRDGTGSSDSNFLITVNAVDGSIFDPIVGY